MAALITADTCPSCQCVHGAAGDWPQCPEHGHWLYVLRGPLAQKDVGWTYACQAHKCTYTHTQRERATMTTDTTTALAIRDGQQGWTSQQAAALTQLGMDGVTEADLQVFLHVCQATGLDPFNRQITMIRRGGKWTIQTEIDGLRVIAHRAAKREGVELSYGPTIWFDAAGGEHKMWLGDDDPAGAAVTVYKNRQMFPGVARFKSFCPLKDGKPMALWAVMPDHMIAKCAEAQALRRAFPHDLEAIVTSDEAGHASAPGAALQEPPRAVPAPQPKPPRRSRTADSAPALRTAISKQFDRLGVEDPDERKNYVYKLANKDADDDVLTEHDLRFALSALRPDECADLAALVELCAPEAAS